jgi:hypothetical protein
VAVFHQAHEVVEEPARLAVPVELVRLEIGGAIAAADEAAKELEASRIVQVEAVAQARADQLGRLAAGIHPKHGLVALHESGGLGAPLHLLVAVDGHGEGRIYFGAPDAVVDLFEE